MNLNMLEHVLVMWMFMNSGCEGILSPAAYQRMVATGELYRRLGVPNPTDALDLSTDGHTLLAGSYRGVAVLWRIDDLPTLIDWTYANRYIRELTCTERELYRLEPLCGEDSDATE